MANPNPTGKGGKRFQKGQSGNPGGRVKLTPELRAIRELTSDELKRVIAKHFRMDKVELKQVSDNPKSSCLDLLIASTITTAIKAGDIGKAEYLFNRTIGRPKETMEITQPEPVIIKKTDGSTVELSTQIESEDD